MEKPLEVGKMTKQQFKITTPLPGSRQDKVLVAANPGVVADAEKSQCLASDLAKESLAISPRCIFITAGLCLVDLRAVYIRLRYVPVYGQGA